LGRRFVSNQYPVVRNSWRDACLFVAPTKFQSRQRGEGRLATSVPIFECQYAIACKVREPANHSSATVGSTGAKFPDEQTHKQTPGGSSDLDLDGVDRSHEHRLTARISRRTSSCSTGRQVEATGTRLRSRSSAKRSQLICPAPRRRTTLTSQERSG
jgi:hypothetical protein